MRKVPPMLFLLFMMACGQMPVMAADATAELVVPDDFVVVSVDGEPYARQVLVARVKHLSLAAGEHRLVLKYKRVFEQGDAIDAVQSDVFDVAVAVQAGGQYHLAYNEPVSLEAARQFAKEPAVNVVADKAGTAAPAKAVAPEVRVSFHPAEIPAPASIPATEAAKSDAPTSSNTLDQLRLWWGKATAAERETFLREVSPVPAQGR